MKRYLATAALARLADEGVGVAAALLALQRTGSAAAGGLVLAAWMAPHVLAAPPVGVYAARARHPRVFHSVALTLFGLAIAALAALLGRAPLWLVLLTAAVGGSCGPVVSGGLSSLLARLVPPDQRARAYGWDAASYNVASIAGPGAVTALASLTSAAVGAAFLALCAVAAAVLATALPRVAGTPPDAAERHAPARAARLAGTAQDPEEDRPGPGAGSAPAARPTLTDGVRALLRIRELRAITIASSLAMAGFGGLSLTAILLAEQLGAADRGGLLVSALAVGALTGSLLVAHRPPAVPPTTLALWSLPATGSPLLLAAWTDSFALALALFAVAGLGDGPLLSATLRVRDLHAPPGARTQVFTLGAGIKITAASAGAALTALLSAHLSPGTLLLCLAATQFAGAAALAPLACSPRRAARGPGGDRGDRGDQGGRGDRGDRGDRTELR